MRYSRHFDRDEDNSEMPRKLRRRDKVGSMEYLTPQKSHHALLDDTLQHQDLQSLGASSGFAPSFSGSRHEREWILSYLGVFYDEGKITDVLRKVKGGKEANVYCCQSHPSLGIDLLAAKIYRPRMFRNLRNDALYREGRTILDEYGKEIRDRRALHAIRKKTDIGKEFSHTAWLQYEYVSMQMLFDAGVDVPEPLASGSNTILMEYVGEIDAPAPSLNEIDLPRSEAQVLFERLLWNIEQMLAHQRIHGDLSAYNVLYWDGKMKIIDFPQAIDPASNRRAFDIFSRDVRRVCQYFSRYGIRADADGLAREMWRKVVGEEEEEPVEE